MANKGKRGFVYKYIFDTIIQRFRTEFEINKNAPLFFNNTDSYEDLMQNVLENNKNID